MKSNRRGRVKEDSLMDCYVEIEGSASVPNMDIRRRNSVLKKDVEEIWGLTQRLRLIFQEEKDDVIYMLVELESADVSREHHPDQGNL